VIARRLRAFLDAYQQLSLLQSGFRSGLVTETAVLHGLSDILTGVDRGDLTVLVLLLDNSAAFDTVDHQILLERFSALVRHQ
jgi:hypothetical protein